MSLPSTPTIPADGDRTATDDGIATRSSASIGVPTSSGLPAPAASSGRYAARVVGIVLASLALVAALNRAIDPYRLFSGDRETIYSGYPALHANIRLHKAHQVNLQRPDALVLGTSKAIQGIPLDHPRFAGRRAYNLAMPLATMEENARLLRHALANGPLEDVVFAVDFLSFNVHARTDGPAAGFDPARLKGTPGERARLAPDRLAALLSLDALRASLAVLRGAEGGDHRVLTGLGGREDAEIRSRLADGGHRSNTRRIEAFFTDSVYLPAPRRAFAFAADGRDSFRWFETFLRDAHAHDVPTTLLIGPSHARLGELIRAAGLESLHEDWKRRLVETNERVARERGRAPFALWDFSLPGTVTTEPFPEAGDAATRMDGYYESIHFNQATGARVLDRIGEAAHDGTVHGRRDGSGSDVVRDSGTDGDGSGDDDGSGTRDDGAADGDVGDRTGRRAGVSEPSAFGTRLTGENVDAALRAARKGQAAFRAANPTQVEEIERIVREVRGDAER